MTVWPDKMRFLTLGAEWRGHQERAARRARRKPATQAQQRAAKPPRPSAALPAAARAKRRPVAGPRQDLKEAREQQAATAEILKVIASSPGDIRPVFQAIAYSAIEIVEALQRHDRSCVTKRSYAQWPPVGLPCVKLGERGRLPYPGGGVAGRAVLLERVTIHVPRFGWRCPR